MRTHDGFFLRTGLGGASLSLKPPVGETLSGSGGAFDLAIGGTLGSGFVLAGDLAFNSFKKTVFNTDITYTLVSLSLLGDWYFDPKGGLHAQLGLGSAGVDAAARGTSGSVGNGGIVTLGVGYDAFVSDEWSLGGLLRFQRVTLKKDDVETATVTNVGVFFVATYH